MSSAAKIVLLSCLLSPAVAHAAPSYTTAVKRKLVDTLKLTKGSGVRFSSVRVHRPPSIVKTRIEEVRRGTYVATPKRLGQLGRRTISGEMLFTVFRSGAVRVKLLRSLDPGRR